MRHSKRVFLVMVFLFLVYKTRADNVAQHGHNDQAELLKKKEEECIEQMQNDPVTFTGLYCNRTWDGLSCWSDTPAGSTAVQPCPSYISLLNKEENATRTCLPNGTWYVHPMSPNKTLGWTFYGRCFKNYIEDSGFLGNFQDNIKELRLLYTIGYSFSLVSLVIAVGIMLYFRRLRCNRNIIHVHLFMSFILRAVIILVRDRVMVQGLGFPGDIAFEDNGTILFLAEGTHWECRMFFTIFHYSLSANYIWIFIEGLYLHMLINVAVFTEKRRIIWYIVAGWGIPWLFIIPWVLARYFLDNSLCWNTHPREELYWIIKGPITATIVINFLFYLNIIRVLFTKLTSTTCTEAAKYRRLAKSVLILIPPFGAYYILFVCITYPKPRLNDTAEIVLLYVEMFFSSFGGFVVAWIFCFLNSEVQYEIKKALYRQSLRSGSSTKYFSYFLNHERGGYSTRPTSNGARESDPYTQSSILNDNGENRKDSRSENILLLNKNGGYSKQCELSNTAGETKICGLPEVSSRHEIVNFSRDLQMAVIFVQTQSGDNDERVTND